MNQKALLIVLTVTVGLLVILNQTTQKRRSKPSSISSPATENTAEMPIKDDTRRHRTAQGNRPNSVSGIAGNTNESEQSQNSTAPTKVDELNVEVFNREDLLRRFAARLQVGMSPAEVTNHLGNPHGIFKYVTNGIVISRQQLTRTEQQNATLPTYWLYTPNFDGSFEWNGVSHQQLIIEFDTNLKTVSWAWETPIFRIRPRLPRTAVAE